MGFSERAQELTQARISAAFTLREKVDERRAFVRDKVAAYTRIVEDEAKEIYGAEIDKLYEAVNVAERAERAQLDEDAKNGVGAKYPVGTVLHEWTIHNWRVPDRPRRLTGKKVRYIAVTSETQFADNLSYPPKVGSYAYRVIKKDGTDGIQILSNAHGYFPEGINPNTPQVKVEE